MRTLRYQATRKKLLAPVTLDPTLKIWRPKNACVHALNPVRTPVAIFGSLGVCIYVPASRHWLISYSPIHLI